MNAKTKQIFFWAPRILTFLFALFISLFALDVFRERLSFWETLTAFSIHLIPTFFILFVLAISHKREWIGGSVFAALGLLYIYWARGKFGLISYLAISGPLILAGLLFWLNWIYKIRMKDK